jgi:hypothetical protein
MHVRERQPVFLSCHVFVILHLSFVLCFISECCFVFGQLLDKYSGVWHHGRVRRYLTSEEWSCPESKGKPWYGLLMLLRKYPEHFVINTRSKGRVTLEFVSLVSLLSWTWCYLLKVIITSVVCEFYRIVVSGGQTSDLYKFAPCFLFSLGKDLLFANVRRKYVHFGRLVRFLRAKETIMCYW